MSAGSFRLDSEHILRPVRLGDGAALSRAYLANREHLAPWEPTRSEAFFTVASQEAHAQHCVDDASAGRGIRFVIESDDGEIRGRMNLNNIVAGRSGAQTSVTGWMRRACTVGSRAARSRG